MAIVKIKKKLKHKLLQGFIWWAWVYEILTNHAYDIYAMNPYLIEMKTWLDEIDAQESM